MMPDLTPALVVFAFAFLCGVAIVMCLALLARKVRAAGGRVSEALVADPSTVARTGAGRLIWAIRGLAVVKALSMVAFAILFSEAVQ